MKTLLNNFERWIKYNNGPAIARQMSALSTACKNGIISQFELKQIKLAVLVMCK